MNILQTIRDTIMPHGIEHFGVCHYGSLPPLLDCRVASRLPENPRAVIVLLFPYYVGGSGQRNVALYAVPDDYHTIAGGILSEVADVLSGQYPAEKFIPFIDNSPIPEKAAARLAGLGVIGRNGLLISNTIYGAYIFIGTVVTTMELAPTPPVMDENGPIGCPGCGDCIEACPTGAISWDKPFDRARCISAITQKKSGLSEWERQQVRHGGLVWGCDVCLTACPLNTTPQVSPIAVFRDSASPWLEPGNIDELLPRKAYGYRPKEVLLRNYHLLNPNLQE